MEHFFVTALNNSFDNSYTSFIFGTNKIDCIRKVMEWAGYIVDEVEEENELIELQDYIDYIEKYNEEDGVNKILSIIDLSNSVLLFRTSQ